MKIAFLYAGQGAQHVGMGKDLYETYPEFKKIYDHSALNFDLKKLSFEGPEETLSLTQFTQPCMTAFACGMTEILKKRGITCDAAAGLSLGEYSALAAAGVFTAEEAIRMTDFRGSAMQSAAAGLDCAMSAVLGLDEKDLARCCNDASKLGAVSICNYNCPGQLVIGGEKAAVEEAARLATEAGAKRCIALKVSGPFHTSLMHKAGDALKEYFKSIDFKTPQIPVYFDCLGGLNKDNVAVPELLEKQVQSSVRMEMILRNMLKDGYDTFVEIGPGKTITGFLRKTAKDMGVSDFTAYAVETVEDVDAIVEALKK